MSNKPKYPKTLVDPSFDVAAYRRDIVKTLATEIFTIVHNEAKVHGKDFADEVFMNLLASYVSTLVFNSLKSSSSAATGELEYKETCDRFAEMKSLIETAVGEGFAGGFQAFNPATSPDYQCDIICLDPGFDDGSVN